MPSARLLIFDQSDTNMRYATGLTLSDPFIWVRLGDRKGKEYVIVNTLEYSRVKQNARRGTKVVLIDKIPLDNIGKPVSRKRNLCDIAAAFLKSYNITEVIVPENIWAVHAETLREHNLRVHYENPYFPERMYKSAAEIAAIKRTGLVTKKAFRKALDIIKKSEIDWNETVVFNGKKLTSEFLKTEIEKIFLENGCSSNESIVSCGKDSAQPHNRGSGPIIAGEPIVIDLFPRDIESGYFFDMTRTVVKGTPHPKLRKLIEAVQKSQLAGIAMVKPGVSCKAVNAACQQVFTKLGYQTIDEEGFIHSTGHGLGLAIHERPALSEKSDDVLQAGMVVTVEPGLYYQELGGVRIEDTVLVTKKGCSNLTNLPRVIVVK